MRKALVAAAAVRGVLEIAAIPLAPFLFRKHAAVLVLLRPTKEVLLFAGYALHHHDISLPVLVLAALPLLTLGVWQFYWLGEAFSDDLKKHDLPGIAGRVLPRKRIKRFESALEREGNKVLLLGRLAAMPSSIISAAAGASKMEWRRFATFDGIGAAASFVIMVGLGWFLEDAYESAGPWLTGLGVIAIAVVAVVIGRALSREGERPRAKRAAASRR
jgi:membrane protein DedA with SNARE-associated domain